MNYSQLEKVLKKANCRIEKTMKDENGNKSITVYVTNAKNAKGGDDVKIMRIATEDKTFDELADAAHGIIIKSGVRLTLMAIASEIDNKEQTGILDANGNPIKH